MLRLFRSFRNLGRRLDALEDSIKAAVAPYVVCHRCGCHVDVEEAVAVRGEENIFGEAEPVFYCKVHVPRKRREADAG